MEKYCYDCGKQVSEKQIIGGLVMELAVLKSNCEGYVHCNPNPDEIVPAEEMPPLSAQLKELLGDLPDDIDYTQETIVICAGCYLDMIND